MVSNPRIAIVGAGLGGLMLARMLYLKDVPFLIFDRDESASHRPQGGMLDLHVETGQYALRRGGLFEVFQKFARYEDQGFRLFDKHGALLLEKADAASGDRPEIDRGQLRELLLESIPEDALRWGHTLRDAEQQDDGYTELRFDNGLTQRFELVVGADGAWSRVRPLVSSTAPDFTGLTLHELSIPDADTRYPDVAQKVGHGMLVAKGGHQTIFAQRNANAHIRVYAALHQPATRPEEKTRVDLLRDFGDWDASLLQLLQVAQEPVRPWPVHILPIGHRWAHRDGVTLLGDAAHLMPPAGEGANLALRDAVDLAEALLDDEDWKAAVRAHEQVMFERAAASAAEAHKMLLVDSAEKIRELMESHPGAEA
ncbi:FAD-dependent oxidoreductase [Pseudomonas gingeri]|uniref:FAD-dependent oxidoreductase n=1 Tax=Pseudomonas gingeri TaxID=117681 RepID=UPI0015A3D686|nr:NAD(P)/FAD-dependent oxidoreductase [Pseudomonas gingeri]NVZ99439.1 FAD-dependent monooxygenase [Pseudomonas gingeri]NWA13484.1 FAD-dependent monooxygenase [Pseudomonas gingeri]NWA55745.1 FAD-dependent monooxygenase [Pseudomonas gingeri]NWA95401.1 FAD-dependent monooxygenase [Pseudomonas gingeri]NWB00488.1 FAD-dependent monooxygenase [Pseudomonas gingeri]